MKFKKHKNKDDPVQECETVFIDYCVTESGDYDKKCLSDDDCYSG